jgi:hypothetical protein
MRLRRGGRLLGGISEGYDHCVLWSYLGRSSRQPSYANKYFATSSLPTYSRISSYSPSLNCLFFVLKGIYKRRLYDAHDLVRRLHCYAFLPLWYSAPNPVTNTETPANMLNGHLSQVSVRINLRPIYTLQIFTLNKRLDALLDHIDLGLELANELTECLGHELLVRKFFTLSVLLLACITW